MTSRQAGRRISAMTAKHRRRRPSRTVAAGRNNQPLRPSERRHLLQLVACAAAFVLLVAVKLLLPNRMEQLNARLGDSLQQNMDVQAVFSAVGRAFAGEAEVPDAARDVYQAVFHPQEAEGEGIPTLEGPAALAVLRPFREALPLPEETPPEDNGTATLAYLLYSQQNLPENVSMEQAILGFDYCTPLAGVLTSSFGYRDHPVQGEERFHYGVDLAADTGTAIGCFADGIVTAVGESSSYGRYCVVAHTGGYTTLYAHCSRVTASSGASVAQGEKIAEVGQTGIATGPHLHFEIQHNGTYLNPVYYVSIL